MKIVCPTITAENTHTYREQIERVCNFAKHLHLDLMDGQFTPNKSLKVEHLWMPDDITCDVHVMYKNPESVLAAVSKFSVRTFIVPAESDANFGTLAERVKGYGMYFGVSLLADTTVESARRAIKQADHVLIFSGNLGHQGGSTADIGLLAKIAEIKDLNSDAEIGWDGGLNLDNIDEISRSGVSVFNVGGYIQFAKDPSDAYKSLVSAAS